MNDFDLNYDYLEEVKIDNINNALKNKNMKFYYVNGKPFETKEEIIRYYKERENNFFKSTFIIKNRFDSEWLIENKDGILKWTPKKFQKSRWDWDSIDSIIAYLKESYPEDRYVFLEKKQIKKGWLIALSITLLMLIVLAIILIILL